MLIPLTLRPILSTIFQLDLRMIWWIATPTFGELGLSTECLSAPAYVS